MQDDIEGRATRKIFWRLMPLLMLGSGFCNLDRANIGFASIRMNADLGLTAAQFGFAAGIFYLGYVLCCVPGILIGRKVGLRLWLPLVMLAWGTCSMATALTTNAHQLSFVRLILGVAEASYIPCALLLLAQWAPNNHRGRFTAWFWFAASVATVAGAPISGFILKFDEISGLRSWHMLFIVEAAPVCLIGIIGYWLLPSDAANPSWLDASERHWLATQRLAQSDTPVRSARTLVRELRNPSVTLLCLANFFIMSMGISFSFFFPPFLRSRGIDVVSIGIGVSLVHGVAACATVLWGRCSDHFAHNRQLVCCAAALVAAIAVLFLPFASGVMLIIFTGCMVQSGLNGAITTFWPLPMAAVGARSAPAVLASVTMFGNVAGLVGPYVTGVLRDRTDGYALSFAMLASCIAVAGLLVLLSRSVGSERGSAGTLLMGQSH